MTDRDDGDDAEDHGDEKPRRRSASGAEGRIDIRAALEAPVRVKQNGESKSIDPYEAMLRQQVHKAIVGRNVPSIKLVLEEAEKHKVIERPPAPQHGGVFVIPKNLPEEVEAQIFDDADYDEQRQSSIIPIMLALLQVISLKRLRRCFNGGRD